MPRLAFGAAVLVVLVGAVSGLAGAGAEGRLFVPGRSLDGVALGMTRAEVGAAWGARHGVCGDCDRQTWYFNERPFEPQGTAAVFERARVVHVFTVWRPDGFETPDGLELGATTAELARAAGPLDRRECDGYYALLDEGSDATTVYYVYRSRLWGFGLTVPDASPCA